MDLKKRMKLYEESYNFLLPIRIPVVIRVDGRAFHTFTRSFEKPFDSFFSAGIDYIAGKLFNGIQNARMCYMQSDEVSVLLVDYNKFDSQQWFGGNLQKMCSISASIAGAAGTKYFGKEVNFDSRVFPIPERDILNYFIWRQRDITRNSIQMVSRKYYSHRETLRKDLDELQEMIFQAGDNWNNYSSYFKRGRMFDKSGLIEDIPIFTQNMKFLEEYLCIEEE